MDVAETLIRVKTKMAERGWSNGGGPGATKIREDGTKLIHGSREHVDDICDVAEEVAREAAFAELMRRSEQDE